MDTQQTNQNQTSFPIDSLGRRIGIVAGFSRFSPEALDAMLQDLHLSMKREDMLFIQTHFTQRAKRDPYLEEIYLFDHILRSARTSIHNIALAGVNIHNPDIMETYRDLLEKQKVLPHASQPLTLQDIMSTASRYLDRIGVRAPAKASSGNEQPIFAKEKALPVHTALVLLIPQEKSALSVLQASDFAKEKLLAWKTVESAGILVSLCRMANGVYLDLNTLPHTDYAELSALAGAWEDNALVALADRNVAELASLTKTLGVRMCYCASVTPDNLLRIRLRNGNPIAYESEFLRDLADSLLFCNVQIPDENMLQVCKHAPADLSFDKGTENRSCSTVITPLQNNIFSATVNTLIDSLLPLIAQGIPRQKITFSLDYGIPEKDISPEELGQDLSMILGAYRVMMELCITDVNSRLHPTPNNERNICSTAQTLHRVQSPPCSFAQANHYIYLLSFRRMGSGLPDFREFRAMCQTAEDLTHKNTISAAFPISGCLTDTLSALCQNGLTLIPEQNALPLFRGYIQGVLLESKTPLSCGMLIGRVATLPQSEDTKSV